MQGLMWRAYTALGFLEYSFIETTEALHPMYVIRALGGGLFLLGALVMAYNLRTVRIVLLNTASIGQAAFVPGEVKEHHVPYTITQTLWQRHQVFEERSFS